MDKSLAVAKSFVTSNDIAKFASLSNAMDKYVFVSELTAKATAQRVFFSPNAIYTALEG